MAIKLPNRNGEYVTSYEGCVLQTYEHNGYHDSYFYAVVYDTETDALREIEYAATAHAGGGSAEIDATPEVLRRAQEIALDRKVARIVEDAKRAARVPELGKQVRVTATRAGTDRKFAGTVVKAGTTGTVQWIGPDRYKRNAMRYGVTLADGKRIFAGIEAFEVLDLAEYEVTAEDVRDRYDVTLIRNFRKDA